jgi:hypothetical protein
MPRDLKAVELGFAHPEAIVLHRERTFGLIEIEGQSIVYVDRAERTHARL